MASVTEPSPASLATEAAGRQLPQRCVNASVPPRLGTVTLSLEGGGHFQ